MLQLYVQHLDEISVLRCVGRLTAGNHEQLCRAAAQEANARVLVLDLAEVAALDAAGLGALARMQARAAARGVRVKLMNVPQRVRELLRITGLLQRFEACSVPEMFDLLCRASRLRAEVPPPPQGHARRAQAA